MNSKNAASVLFGFERPISPRINQMDGSWRLTSWTMGSNWPPEYAAQIRQYNINIARGQPVPRPAVPPEKK